MGKSAALRTNLSAQLLLHETLERERYIDRDRDRERVCVCLVARIQEEEVFGRPVVLSFTIYSVVVYCVPAWQHR